MKIGLIDFGASREFSKAFTDKYLRILLAAQNQDKEEILKQSYEIGFLTGDETQVIINYYSFFFFSFSQTEFFF